MTVLMAMALAVGCRAEQSSASDSACVEQSCGEADAGDSDSSATADCENVEVWCDGIDQDCDGADATDEIPYDGLDQDCDGSDLVDVDGDGFDAAAVGGEDCNDDTADVYPGAAEVLGDEADNDCDGYIDEVVACPDGSGDALTIQEAVDAAADGGTVEICPGRWTEHALLTDRVLTLVGGGDMPGDTVLDASGGVPVVTVSGHASTVTLNWLSLQADDVDDQLVGFVDGPTVELRRLDISNDGEATAGMIYLTGSCEGSDGSLTMTLSRVRGQVWLSGWCANKVSFVGNTISGDAFVVLGPAADTAEFRNNIVTSGIIWFDAEYALLDWYQSGSSSSVTNNVFADIESMGFGTYQYYGTDYDVQAPIEIVNNIFAAVRFGGTDDAPAPSYVGDILADGPTGTRYCNDTSPEDAAPSIRNNLHYESSFPEPAGVLSCRTYYDHGDIGWQDWAAFDAELLVGFDEVDPKFAYSAESGSYTLSSGSPAVDTGSGADDPDGSPPDIGAFGGPDGNWFKEYPWPLD